MNILIIYCILVFVLYVTQLITARFTDNKVQRRNLYIRNNIYGVLSAILIIIALVISDVD